MSRIIFISLLIVAVTAQQAAPAAPAAAAAQQAPATVDLSSVHQKLDTLAGSVQSLSDLKSSLSSLSSAQATLQSSLQTLTQESNALKQAVEQQKAQPTATPAAPVDVSGLTNKFTESQSSLAAISSTIEKTLATLTAAQEASEKSKASVAELSSKAEAKWTTITNELRDIKNLLQTISTASAGKKDDNKASDAHHSLLSKIEETQKAILHKLEHSSLTHQFWNGYEQLRVHAVHYGREFWALTERGVARAQEYAPIVTEKAQSIYETLSTDGLKHATTAYGHGEQFVLDSHGRLTSILSQQGVPHEHAPLASISILSLLGLIVVILYVKLLFAFLRCITCRSGKKVVKKGTPAPAATPAKKK